MRDTESTRLSFSFKLTRGYNDILALNVSDEIIPAGEAAIPYLRDRISKELERVTGLKLPDIEESDRGE